jgi:hypothetical protein
MTDEKLRRAMEALNEATRLLRERWMTAELRETQLILIRGKVNAAQKEIVEMLVLPQSEEAN